MSHRVGAVVRISAVGVLNYLVGANESLPIYGLLLRTQTSNLISSARSPAVCATTMFQL